MPCISTCASTASINTPIEVTIFVFEVVIEQLIVCFSLIVHLLTSPKKYEPVEATDPHLDAYIIYLLVSLLFSLSPYSGLRRDTNTSYFHCQAQSFCLLYILQQLNSPT